MSTHFQRASWRYSRFDGTQTAPLIDFYQSRGVLQRFDNSGAPRDTVAAVVAALGR